MCVGGHYKYGCARHDRIKCNAIDAIANRAPHSIRRPTWSSAFSCFAFQLNLAFSQPNLLNLCSNSVFRPLHCPVPTPLSPLSLSVSLSFLLSLSRHSSSSSAFRSINGQWVRISLFCPMVDPKRKYWLRYTQVRFSSFRGTVEAVSLTEDTCFSLLVSSSPVHCLCHRVRGHTVCPGIRIEVRQNAHDSIYIRSFVCGFARGFCVKFNNVLTSAVVYVATRIQFTSRWYGTSPTIDRIAWLGFLFNFHFYSHPNRQYSCSSARGAANQVTYSYTHKQHTFVWAMRPICGRQFFKVST